VPQTTSTTYVSTPLGTGNAAAQVVVNVTGTHEALVSLNTSCSNASNNQGCLLSFAVSGATTLAASDARAVGIESLGAGAHFVAGAQYLVTLNSGSNTITANYRATGGTASFATSTILVTVF